MIDWSTEDVSSLKGVGSKIREKLIRLGIENKRQMLFHLPFRYEDRTRIYPLGSLQNGQPAVIEAEVLQAATSFRRQGRSRRVLVIKLSDGTGFLTLRFFHFNAAQQAHFEKGNTLRCYGEVRWVMGGPEMIHPEYQVIDPFSPQPLDDNLTPIYPTTEGLHQLGLRKMMQQLMLQLKQQPLPEILPDTWLQQQSLPEVSQALRILHNPSNPEDVDKILKRVHPAQTRFIIEELAAHRLSLLKRRELIRQMDSPTANNDGQLQQQLRDKLNFELTDAQDRVISDINNDLSVGKPMLRLVQGDVGSGKTVVAAMAALPLIRCGYQVALMAPTEILAQQHVQNFIQWLEPLGIRVESLMGADKGKKRALKEQMIASGEAGMVIGTHALFQQSVEFADLGMIIIDEQHRFGVEQRLALQQKAGHRFMPHQLIMTATPIPRTLAMSIYADLDYSQIDELPPGRTPVKTSIIAETKRDELVDSVYSACRDGKQVYWVCTLIEESESLQCEAAEQTYVQLQQQMPEINIGLVHGRMKPAQKEALIQAFKSGEIHCLVATTVIEVGVDVPNASIMIIENPERLGLSQIHQLRGRVGRGSEQSYCLLLVKNNLSQQASNRLEVIRNHQDGFVIAEKDLEIRGAGEVLGTRQTGDASFRIADLVADKQWFDAAKDLAQLLMQPEYESHRQKLQDQWLGSHQQFSNVG